VTSFVCLKHPLAVKKRCVGYFVHKLLAQMFATVRDYWQNKTWKKSFATANAFGRGSSTCTVSMYSGHDIIVFLNKNNLPVYKFSVKFTNILENFSPLCGKPLNITSPIIEFCYFDEILIDFQKSEEKI
jgi:hypothetical protein